GRNTLRHANEYIAPVNDSFIQISFFFLFVLFCMQMSARRTTLRGVAWIRTDSNSLKGSIEESSLTANGIVAADAYFIPRIELSCVQSDFSPNGMGTGFEVSNFWLLINNGGRR
ncbi:MAG TPA: hypothetical protein VK901_18245, partial [Nitrospiraceae bacterium]|nr:hypothetical protein [Nitrospiraceae bacterium]